MSGAPFLDQLPRFGGKVFFVNTTVFDFDQRLMLSVDGVEMFRRMLTVVETDNILRSG